MRHRSLAVAILCALALPAFGADSALHCGQLFDSRSGKLLGAHTVVVGNGKVAEVLAGRAEAVADATTIAMPGDPLAGNVMQVDFVVKDRVVYRAPQR